MGERVDLERIGGGVAVVTLDRPERLNALTDAMMDEQIPAVCAAAAADTSIRIVVVRGGGDNFCSGGDVGDRVAAVADQLVGESSEPPRELGRFVLPFLQMSKPVIAAVDGVAAGGGLAIALACDLRVASSRARFYAPFIRRGLVPDGGLTYTLLRALGWGRALDLCLTGRAVGGEEALQIGLVERCWPTETWWSQTLDLAESIASGPSRAMLLTKQAFMEARLENVSSALIRESWFQLACMRDPAFKEGIAAFLERRPPSFHQDQGNDSGLQ
jgi:2-(1,2-epoxy-1,2-dihydrophenyl)acetyl-CoA isomerase